MPVSADGYRWVTFNRAESNSWSVINIGKDKDGKDLVVGRFHHAGDVLPAKVKPATGEAWAAYAGKEHKTDVFEVLVAVRYSYKWVPEKNGQVPYNAVPVGLTVTGETLYAGRARKGKATLGGKVHGSLGRMYAPYHGTEHHFTQYEVLVQT